MTATYEEFLDHKRITAEPVGFKFGPLHPSMRVDQNDIGEQLDEDLTVHCRKLYEEQMQRFDGSRMTFEEFKSIQIWQRYADPVWDDIDPSDTLQRESAREEKDERHIEPLQLQIIRRGLHLWTEKGDLVLSPFGGIGSEGYVAIQEGREAVICELKASYFKQACLNMDRAESEVKQPSLFDDESGPRSDEWMARLGVEEIEHGETAGD